MFKMKLTTLILCCLFLATHRCSAFERKIAHWKVKKVREIPSNPNAFTQGLIYDKGMFYLSTGLYNQSSLQSLDAQTGETIQIIQLNPNEFGEGLTKVDDHLFQLTWKKGKALAYKKSDKGYIRDPENDFSYQSEGWGLTSDGHSLILSDGSSIIRFLSKKNKSVVKTITVTYNGKPVEKINELEFVKGKIFANILGTNQIIAIDPDSGYVTDLIDVDVKKLFHPQSPPLLKDNAAVLNGIAYDPETGHLYITGKLWPKIFEVSLEYTIPIYTYE